MAEKGLPHVLGNSRLFHLASAFPFHRVNLSLLDPLARVKVFQWPQVAPGNEGESSQPISERLFGGAWGAGIAHCPHRMIHSLVLSGGLASGGARIDPERGWHGVRGG